MKQAYKNLEKSQFERLGDKFQTVVLWTGVLFFASLLCRVLYEETAYRPFFNQFNPVVKFLINHSIKNNLPMVAETLRHEMVHAALAVGGVSFSVEYDEEVIVRCLDSLFFPAWDKLTKRS